MKYLHSVTFGIIVLIVGIYLSDVFDLYNRFDYIDKFFHFSGGVALGWFFYIFFDIRNLPMSVFRKIAIVVSATCLVAVFWEYAERLSTLYAPKYIVHWFSGGNINDTLLDILAGMVGGGVAFYIANKIINK